MSNYPEELSNLSKFIWENLGFADNVKITSNGWFYFELDSFVIWGSGPRGEISGVFFIPYNDELIYDQFGSPKTSGPIDLVEIKKDDSGDFWKFLKKLSLESDIYSKVEQKRKENLNKALDKEKARKGLVELAHEYCKSKLSLK